MVELLRIGNLNGLFVPGPFWLARLPISRSANLLPPTQPIRLPTSPAPPRGAGRMNAVVPPLVPAKSDPHHAAGAPGLPSRRHRRACLAHSPQSPLEAAHGGGSGFSPRWVKILRIDARSRMQASNFIFPPQRGHDSSS